MFKSVQDRVWVFDAEWVPDPVAGRLLYDLPSSMADHNVMEIMWQRGGATKENPTPFLNTALCRIVSVAVLVRSISKNGEVSISLRSIPALNETDEQKKTEAYIISTFLEAVGQKKPQLVGYNSVAADLRIFIQRAIINGLCVPEFARRPNKPWEGADYFSAFSDHNVDLMSIISGNRSAVALDKIACLSGIPGKLDLEGYKADGNQVACDWLDNKLNRIICYNQCDVLTTYLLWLRCARFGGFLDQSMYRAEQELVRDFLREADEQSEHLLAFLKEWQRLERILSYQKN